MYSVVLATMMATSTNTPDCWKKYCSPPPRVYSCGGCNGCYGYTYSYYRPVSYVAYSCYGCRGVPVVTYSCAGCFGGVPQYRPVTPPPFQTPMPKAPQATPKPALPSPSQSSSNSNQATVVFKAPLDIQISLGEILIQRSSEEEVHVTPALENGKNYSYSFKATRKGDDSEVSVTKKVEVKPGATVVVEFREFPTISTVAR
ncbi:MAG: TIGR03000 domain-containing protein [Gemmataceae bacterium]|nr:TIGR03000 domain-containing protein [Gemmataceae bacterium]